MSNPTSSFDLARELGVKSYSFRHIKDNVDVAAAVRRCASDGIDLSACHVNYDDPAQQEQALAAYRAAGVRVSGIGVVGLRPDEAWNRRFFEFARRAGCGVVSFSFDPDGYEETLRSVEKLCEEFGVRAAIHNHGGRHWLGNSTILDYIFRRTNAARIGLCLDTAWCLQAGDSPVAWLEKFAVAQPRLFAMHLKDFVFTEKGQCHDTIVGHGALDLPAFLKVFRSLPVAFNGSAVVEYEGDDAVEATARCVESIRAAWAAVVASQS